MHVYMTYNLNSSNRAYLGDNIRVLLKGGSRSLDYGSYVCSTCTPITAVGCLAAKSHERFGFDLSMHIVFRAIWGLTTTREGSP